MKEQIDARLRQARDRAATDQSIALEVDPETLTVLTQTLGWNEDGMLYRGAQVHVVPDLVGWAVRIVA